MPWRWPAYAINGLTVAIGIALLHLACTAWAHPLAAQWATGGAICASLADVPDTARRSWRKVGLGAALGGLSMVLVAASAHHGVVTGLIVALVAGLSALMLAWGPRAGPVAFAPVLAMVFAMASPPRMPLSEMAAWVAAGGLWCVGWAWISSTGLVRWYGRQALAEVVGDLADLIQARSRMLRGDEQDLPNKEAALLAWVTDEARLAERIQSARDLLFEGPPTSQRQRERAMLLRAIDFRDLLLASLVDHDLLGDDEVGQALRSWLAAELDVACADLLSISTALRFSEAASPPSSAPGQSAASLEAAVPEGDRRRALLPALDRRIGHLRRELAAMRALAAGANEHLAVPPDELRQFVSPYGWPLAALRRNLTMSSPVARHALRSALALGSAYGLALVLPWASHPQWLVLSVAVVLRGNLEQTLARRNARVLGTVAGCLVVLALQRLAPLALTTAVFIVAVGVAHGFAVRFYLLTAMAASVMSLLQVHLADPAASIPVAERLADTILGALLAWAFSYVLPAWERRLMPLFVVRAMQSLKAYADLVLQARPEQTVAERLARRQAYDALVAVGAALRRSAAEPKRVHPPVVLLGNFLDLGQRLMAQLSMVRLLRLRQAEQLKSAETAALAESAMAAARGELGNALELRPAASPRATGPEDAGELNALTAVDELSDWLSGRLGSIVRTGAESGRAARAALAALKSDASRPRG